MVIITMDVHHLIFLHKGIVFTKAAGCAVKDCGLGFLGMFELIERPKGRRSPEMVFPAEN